MFIHSTQNSIKSAKMDKFIFSEYHLTCSRIEWQDVNYGLRILFTRDQILFFIDTFFNTFDIVPRLDNCDVWQTVLQSSDLFLFSHFSSIIIFCLSMDMIIWIWGVDHFITIVILFIHWGYSLRNWSQFTGQSMIYNVQAIYIFLETGFYFFYD